MLRYLTLVAAALFLNAPAPAQAEPLRITLDQGVIEPMPYALPQFAAEGGGGQLAAQISDVIRADLSGTGLFREIPPRLISSRSDHLIRRSPIRIGRRSTRRL